MSALLARFLEAWPAGGFDSYAAWLAYDEMDLRADLARELRSKFHDNAWQFGDALIEGIQASQSAPLPSPWFFRMIASVAGGDLI
jgi:hypothetical protein